MQDGKTLRVLESKFAVARLDPLDPVPTEVHGGAMSSITRTAHELSIVTESSRLPRGIRAERNWRALEVQGPLDFGLTGVVAGFTSLLAEQEIPVFVISTFDTDYLLLPGDHFGRALELLHASGRTLLDVDGVPFVPNEPSARP